MTIYAHGHDGWTERLNRQPNPQMYFEFGDLMEFQVLLTDNRVCMVQAVNANHAIMRVINLWHVTVKGVCPIQSSYRSV